MTLMHAAAPAALPLALSMGRAPAELRRRHRQTTRRHLLLLQRRVRANMSGRSGVTYTPLDGGQSGEIGPRVQTGDTRRRVHVTPLREVGGAVYGEVTTDAVHSLRLEFGFTGTDALGRDYNQPPYPAWRPAADVTQPEYHDAIERDYLAVERLIGGGR